MGGGVGGAEPACEVPTYWRGCGTAPTCWAKNSALYPQLILKASVRCCPPQSFSVPKLEEIFELSTPSCSHLSNRYGSLALQSLFWKPQETIVMKTVWSQDIKMSGSISILSLGPQRQFLEALV